jgi:hypothetical protein
MIGFPCNNNPFYVSLYKPNNHRLNIIQLLTFIEVKIEQGVDKIGEAEN